MAVTIAASAATLLATIFFPKLFTISAQSKLNRQKEHEQMMAYSQCPPYSPPTKCTATLGAPKGPRGKGGWQLSTQPPKPPSTQPPRPPSTPPGLPSSTLQRCR